MGLSRLLALIFIVWLAFYYIKRLRNVRKFSGKEKKPAKIDKMVRCKTCGLYIPEEDAIRNNGQYFCSTEHLENSDH